MLEEKQTLFIPFTPEELKPAEADLKASQCGVLAPEEPQSSNTTGTPIAKDQTTFAEQLIAGWEIGWNAELSSPSKKKCERCGKSRGSKKAKKWVRLDHVFLEHPIALCSNCSASFEKKHLDRTRSWPQTAEELVHWLGNSGLAVREIGDTLSRYSFDADFPNRLADEYPRLSLLKKMFLVGELQEHPPSPPTFPHTKGSMAKYLANCKTVARIYEDARRCRRGAPTTEETKRIVQLMTKFIKVDKLSSRKAAEATHLCMRPHGPLRTAEDIDWCHDYYRQPYFRAKRASRRHT